MPSRPSRPVATLVAAGLVLGSGLLGLTLAAPASAATAVRHVAANGSDTTGDAPNDCTGAAQPCRTIQHAVDVADAGDAVDVGAGTFAEAVTITKSLTVRGAGAGTVVRGDGSNVPSVGVEGTEGTVEVTLEDLSASGNAAGLGLVVVGATAHLRRVHADDNGAGVVAIVASLDATDSTFSGNGGGQIGTEFSGTGITAAGSAVRLLTSTIAGNAGSGVSVQGGGLVGVAAVAPPTSSAVVERSTVSGNGVGGVVSTGADVQVLTSTVSGNVAGGVVQVSFGGPPGAVQVRNSTVTGTTLPADTDGVGNQLGGVLNLTQDTGVPDRIAATYRPSTREQRALGALSARLRPAVQKAAARKVAAAAPAAVPAAGTVTLAGSVVAAQGDGLPDCQGPITDGGDNLSSDAANSCGLTAAEHSHPTTAPHLGPLADNGGVTLTHLVGKGSPAVDAIATGRSGCTTDAVDQRGVTRPQGGRCDIGAVEAEQTPVVLGPASLPHGTVGEAYHARLTASGGLGAPYAWTLAPGSSLPAGLRLSATGVLSGTPTTAGRTTFTVSVDDPTLHTYTIVIEAATAPNGGSSSPIATGGSGAGGGAAGGTGGVANTGVAAGPLAATGIAAVLAGIVLLLAANVLARRPARHRAG